MSYPQILGVFSYKADIDMGTGGSSGKHSGLTYWYARRIADQEYELQPLNGQHVPSGVKTKLAQIEFLSKYTPEPEYYRVNTLPVLNSLYKKIQKGEEYFKLGMLDETEREFVKALMIDDLSVPANFGLGSVYSEKKEYHKLKGVLDLLLNLDETFVEEQQARFNEFGMNLRKNGFLDESIRYYSKALEINGNDDHQHFNLARVYYDKKELDKCVAHLKQALEINPGLVEAQKFLAYCRKKHGPGAGA